MNRHHYIAFFVMLAAPTQDPGMPVKSNSTAAVMLEASILSTSRSEKLDVRSDIIKQFPDSLEAIFAKAYIAGIDGQNDTKLLLYRACLKAAPTYVPCLLNLASSLDSNNAERTVLYQRAFAANRGFANGEPAKRLFEAYGRGSTDRAALLAELAQIPSLSYLVHLLTAQQHEAAGDEKAAEREFLAAIAANPNDFDPFRDLAALRLKKVPPNSKLDADELRPFFQPINEFTMANPRSSEALQYAAETLAQRFGPGISKTVAELAKLSFARHPTAEAVTAGADALFVESPEEAVAFARAAASRLNRNPDVLREYARNCDYAAATDCDAERLLKEAENHARCTDDLIRITSALGRHFEVFRGDYRRAKDLYTLNRSRGESQRAALERLYSNRLRAADFPQALDMLNQLEREIGRSSSPNEVWFSGQRQMLRRYLATHRAQEDFFARNPFLRFWEEIIGPSLRSRLEFAAGSAELSPEIRRRIQAVARLLKEEDGATSYALSVEGHADESESNTPELSAARAKAVRQALYAEGVPLSRLLTTSFAASLPVGPSIDESSRGQNRRVEIVPSGKLTDPTFVVSAAMTPNKALAVSPDARLVALGTSPVQLWDLSAGSGRKVRDLGRGNSVREFSPNGRYLAVASDYSEASGNQDIALLVYDVKTGFPVVQLPEWSALIGVAWNPQSSRLAYIAGRSLVMYDLLAKQRVGTRWLPPGRDSGTGLVWTKDGRFLITGQHRRDRLDMWSADDLSPVRTLPGIDWPHELGQTSDGKLLFCVDNRSILTVWDTSTWGRRALRVNVVPSRIAVHPSSHLIAFDDWTHGDAAKVTLVDLDRLEVRGTADAPPYTSFAFTADGTRLLEARTDRLIVRDAATLTSTNEITGAVPAPLWMIVDDHSRRSLVASGNSILVWDIASAKPIHRWAITGRQLARVAPTESRYVLASEVDSKGQSDIYELDAATLNPPRKVMTVDGRVDQVATFTGGVAFTVTKYFRDTGDDGQKRHVAEPAGSVYLLKNDLTVSDVVTVPLVTEHLVFGGASEAGFGALAVSENGDALATATNWTDGWKTGRKVSTIGRVFTVKTGQERQRFEGAESIIDLRFTAARELEIARTSRSSIHGLTTQTSRPSSWRPGYSEMKTTSGMIVKWDHGTLDATDPSGRERFSIVFEDSLQSVDILESASLVLALTTDGELQFRELSDGGLRLRTWAGGPDEWIAYSLFSGISTRGDLIGRASWSLGDQMLAYEALPLPQSAEVAAHALNSRQRLNPQGPWSAPSAVLMALNDKDAVTLDDGLLADVVVGAEVLINGQEATVAELDRQTNRVVFLGPSGSQQLLRDGVNTFKRKATELKESVTLWLEEKRLTRFEVPYKQSHALVIAVDEYTPDTGFPKLDGHRMVEGAKTLVGLLQELGFPRDHIVTLYDSQATSGAIATELMKFWAGGEKANADRVFVYFGGHGVEAASNRGALVTHDFRPSRPTTTSVLLTDLTHRYAENMVAKHAMFALDACGAGLAISTQGDSQESKSRVARLVAIKNNVTVPARNFLLAGRGREKAMWENGGVFTKFLLEGLRGRADSNQDGVVTFDDLFVFVRQEVGEYALRQNIEQVPTSHVLSAIGDGRVVFVTRR